MTEKGGEEVFGGEKKLILITTIILLLITVGIFFVSFYPTKDEKQPVVRKLGTAVNKSLPIDTEYAIQSGLPEGFVFHEMGLIYSSGVDIWYSKNKDKFMMSFREGPIERFRAGFNTSTRLESDLPDVVYKTNVEVANESISIYGESRTMYLWWHDGVLLSVSSTKDDENLLKLTEFFIEKFPPTEKLL